MTARDTPREGSAEQCKMKTYGGFFIMAGPPPRGVKPERCPLPAKPNGYCENHNPEDW